MTLVDKLSRANKAFQRVSNQYQATKTQLTAAQAEIARLQASISVLSDDRQSLRDLLIVKKRELAAAVKPARKPRKAKEPSDNPS